MSNETPTYTDEQIIERAQGNVNGISIVLLKYCKERDLSWKDLASYMAREFAKGWQPGLTAKDFAYGMAVNVASSGAEVQSVSGNEVSAEAVFKGWPAEETLEFYGVTREEFDSFLAMPKALAKNLGLDVEFRRDGDVLTMAISR